MSLFADANHHCARTSHADSRPSHLIMRPLPCPIVLWSGCEWASKVSRYYCHHYCHHHRLGTGQFEPKRTKKRSCCLKMIQNCSRNPIFTKFSFLTFFLLIILSFWSFSCICNAGFGGQHCDILLCHSSLCLGPRSICENTMGGPVCHCEKGREGTNCELIEWVHLLSEDLRS